MKNSKLFPPVDYNLIYREGDIRLLNVYSKNLVGPRSKIIGYFSNHREIPITTFSAQIAEFTTMKKYLNIILRLTHGRQLWEIEEILKEFPD